MTENPFEIPQTTRDWAEQNVGQANAAYEQLSDSVNKGFAMGLMSSEGFKNLQDRAMEFAMENAEVSLHVCQQSLQRKDCPGNFDVANTVRSRPHPGLR